MGSTIQLLPLLFCLTIFKEEAHCEPPYTYNEGTIGTYDVVIADCTYDIGGISNKILQLPLILNVNTEGTVISYMDVQNLMKEDQATVVKAGGGLGQGWVQFNITSQKDHGCKFHFKIYGRVPSGKTEHVLLGDCRKRRTG